jgi:threonine dehydratase
VTPTPLEEATLAGRRLLLKREDVHPLGAFKWRGALPVLERYAANGARAVVTASTGNHGGSDGMGGETRRPRCDRVRTGNGQLGEARAYRR